MDFSITEIHNKVDNIIALLEDAEIRHASDISAVHPDFRDSAINLIHYCELRKNDLTTLQYELGKLGMSRLARAEEHVMASLKRIRYFLDLMMGIPTDRLNHEADILKGQLLLKTHTDNALGVQSSHRRARIMVTIPFEAAGDYAVIASMINAGMNIARINCAHDDEKIWLQMIDTIRQASTDLKSPVKIMMDLAGPKLRTGLVAEGPAVIKAMPRRDAFGNWLAPAQLSCYRGDQSGEKGDLPLEGNFTLEGLDGQVYRFRDARGKKRRVIFSKVHPRALIGSFDKTCYLIAGVRLTPEIAESPFLEIGAIPSKQGYLTLSKGDIVMVDTNPQPGTEASENKPARIPCTLPEAIEAAQVGERIYFDDGKIKGKIIEKLEDSLKVQVVRTSKRSAKLRAEKGINLPDTSLPVKGLTAKDRQDLQFVARHADGVNISFLSSPVDIRDLLDELEKVGATQDLSVILKIETRQAFIQLRDILLEALRWPTLGVMIARGDLAIETGWDHIGRIQKEIIKMTSAAHLPVIWATQVLDNLARKGYPSRSEITDATSSIRAECVMLNKGPYILKAIELLDKLLEDTEHFQQKNFAMLPKMLELTR